MRVFKETQKFDQWFMKAIYFGMIAMLLFFIYTFYDSDSVVNKTDPDAIIAQIMVYTTSIAAIILFRSLGLRTEIDEIGIHYRFIPFHNSKRTIRWSEMEKCYVRTYRPIREYGGWGIKASLGKGGTAYNVKGNKGIQINLNTGKKLLIGTQKESEAQQVIDRHFLEK